MHGSTFNLGESGSEQLIARRPESEMPEFDITAMIDLVFMMNIYFLVTFITIALGELDLPAANHASAHDADVATIITMKVGSDGVSAVVFLGNGDAGEAIHDPAEQQQRIAAAVEEAVRDA